MTRSRLRPFALAAGTFALCLAATGSAPGQGSVDLKPYRIEAKPVFGDTMSKMFDMQAGKLFVTGPELKANQKLFRDVAQSTVYRLTYEQYYTSPDSGELRPRPNDASVDYLLNDLSPRILVPTAATGYSTEQRAYVHEFGAALDESIVAVLTKGGMPPTVIRANAGRMLAMVARSGAPAHAKTILALLTNKFYKVGDKYVETPPELLYYALKAAENLLAAYDAVAHLTPTNPARHSIPDADLEALIKAIEPMILSGPPVAHLAAEADPDKAFKPGSVAPEKGEQPVATPGTGPVKPEAAALTAEQTDLIRFFRRQAVRALARVRYDTVRDARPALTLTKVAVSDVSIVPAPNAGEVAEAVLGLLGMNPTPTLNTDEWAFVIALGYDTLLRARTGPEDKSIPWRVYAAKMTVAVDALKRTAAVNARLRPMLPTLTALADTVKADIITPLSAPPDRATETPPKVDRLYEWMSGNVPKDPSRSLYNDGPQYTYAARSAQKR